MHEMHESGEMYLETIYVLNKKSPEVRSVDVAEYMGFSKPSVSRGVGILKQGGYLTVDANGFLELTDAGTEVAKKIKSVTAVFIFVYNCVYKREFPK